MCVGGWVGVVGGRGWKRINKERREGKKGRKEGRRDRGISREEKGRKERRREEGREGEKRRKKKGKEREKQKTNEAMNLSQGTVTQYGISFMSRSAGLSQTSVAALLDRFCTRRSVRKWSVWEWKGPDNIWDYGVVVVTLRTQVICLLLGCGRVVRSYRIQASLAGSNAT